eukprot:TRINITY_DN854_c0_g3_i1.p1 TRINITY_DN854_c0_g3~~TRINITY_DN854_c0_g3_i1.p1  ORF type:complete len:319 (+),score=-37.23 TRINITY_DN854_c0_g3_i1:586-1542(+)
MHADQRKKKKRKERKQTYPMYYLKCDKCGHYNAVYSEYMVYCGKCKTHLTNNYIDWVNTNSTKSFEDYKRTVCIHESELPKQPVAELKPESSKLDVKPESSQKRRKKLSKAQMVGIIVGAVVAAVFSQIGKHLATNVREDWQKAKIEKIDFAASDTTNWEAFHADEAGFSVLFPHSPSREAQSTDTEIGELEVVQYSYQPEIGDDANMLYGVGYTTYPVNTINSETLSAEQLRQVLDGSVNGAVSNVKGTLLSSNNISYKGYPGREIKVEIRNGLAVAKMISYLVKDKMYIIQVISPAKNGENASIDYFINSFKIDGI